MPVILKVIKINNELGVKIPKRIAMTHQIKIGDEVWVEIMRSRLNSRVKAELLITKVNSRN